MSGAYMNSFNTTILRGNITGAMSYNMTKPRYVRDYSTLMFLIPTSVLIAIVNGLVFLLFAVRKPLRTPANYLLLSLALSDFITGVVIVPIMMCVLVPLYLDKAHYLGITFAMSVLVKLTAVLTSFHILAVTVEKYLAIVKPLKHHIANPGGAGKVILGIWVMSASIAMVPLSWSWKFLTKERSRALQFQFGYDVFCFVVVFLIPYIIITYSQAVMFKAVSHSTNTSQLRRCSLKKTGGKWSNERKCLVIFASMAVLFAVCWLPWFLLSSLATVSEIFPAVSYNITMDLYTSFLIIRLLTSIINPVLYTFFKRDFMAALKIVICRQHHLTRKGSVAQAFKMNKNGEEDDGMKASKRTRFAVTSSDNQSSDGLLQVTCI